MGPKALPLDHMPLTPVLLTCEERLSSNLSHWAAMFLREEESGAVLHLLLKMSRSKDVMESGLAVSPRNPHLLLGSLSL